MDLGSIPSEVEAFLFSQKKLFKYMSILWVLFLFHYRGYLGGAVESDIGGKLNF